MQIGIQDTHRLPYMKAEFTAMRLGTTQPLKFFDSDGQELGYRVYTNADGFICDANGNLLGNGVFVQEDALITGYYNGAVMTQWVVRAQTSGMVVNDGKMLNKDGDVVWSANSAVNYKLNFNDLANTPALNEWREDELVVTIEEQTDFVVVGKYVKVLYLITARTDPYLVLGISPEYAERYGQNIFVKNPTSSIVTLVNTLDQSVVCKIKPNGSALISLLSTHLFVALETTGSGEGDYEMKVVTTTGAGDTALEYITDDSQRMLIVQDIANVDNITAMAKKFFSTITSTRKIVILWQPIYNVSKKLDIQIPVNQVYWTKVAELVPYIPCEFIVSPVADGFSMTPVGYELEGHSNAVVLNAPCTLNTTALVSVPSAATVAILNVTDIVASAGKTPVIVRLKVEPKSRSRIMLMIAGGFENIASYEIQLQIMCGTQRLVSKWGDTTDEHTGSIVNADPIYRNYTDNGSHKFTDNPSFVLDIEAMDNGGFYHCSGPDNIYDQSAPY